MRMMNFFWSNVFEYFKERRLAALFFSTLALLMLVLALAAVFYQTAAGLNLLRYWPVGLPGAGLLLFSLSWRSIRRVRAQRLDRYQSTPLSRDELAKARSKLRTKSNSKSSC